MAFPQDDLCPVVQVQFGGQWVDLSTRVRDGIRLRVGGESAGPVVLPGSASFALEDGDGFLSPDNPASPYYPYIDVAAPVRMLLPPGMVPDEDRALFAGEVTGWEPFWVQGVEDEARVAVRVAGILERLSAADTPLESPLKRAVLATGSKGSTVVSPPVAYWPMEDDDGAQQFASGLPGGGAPMSFSEFELSASSAIPGAAPLPIAPGRFRANVSLPGGSTGWLYGFAIFVPPVPGQPHRLEIATSGGDLADIVISITTTGATFNGRDEDENTVVTQTVVRDISSLPTWMEMAVWQIGTSVYYQLSLDDESPLIQTRTNTILDKITRVSGVIVEDTTGASAPQSAIGHQAVWPAASSVRGATGPAVRGFVGEFARDRVLRLGAEESIQVATVGDVPVATDDFDRTESGDWGTAPTGQVWTHEEAVSANVTWAVTPGAATVTGEAGHSGAVVAYLPNAAEVENLEILTQVTLPAGVDTTLNLVIFPPTLDLINDPPTVISWAILSAGDANNANAGAQIDAVLLSSHWGARQDGWPDGERIWIRAQAQGDLLRLRAWTDGEVEPAGWLVDALVRGSSAIRGQVGILWTPGVGDVLTVHEFSVAELPRSARMGVQQQATLLANLEDCATTDLGILSELRDDTGLEYRPLSTLYNQSPVMELACSTDTEPGQVGAGTYLSKDTRSIRNDRTVSRQGGSSARAVQETGLRSVSKPPDGVGRYASSDTAHPASDLQLPDLAAWLLHLGVDATTRVPTLPVDLAFSPELISTWQKTRIGDRFDLTRLPRQVVGPLPLLLRGWSAFLDADQWQVRINATPYSPYVVGQRADDPSESDVVVEDTFTRTVVDGWGTADTGQVWLLTGTAADFDVAAGGGTISEDGTSFEGRWATLDVDLADVELLTAITFQENQPGDGGLVARTGSDPSQDSYEFVLFGPVGDQLHIGRTVSGTFTELVSTPFPITAGVKYRIKARCAGDLLQCKTWADGDPEPAGWMLSATDTSHTSGRVGVEHFGDSGNLTASFDDFQVFELPVPGPADAVRRDTAGSQTTAPFAVGVDTELVVATTLGPLWAETGASNLHLPLDVATGLPPGVQGRGGIRLRATDIAAVPPSAQSASTADVSGGAPATTVDIPVPSGDLDGRLLIILHAARTSVGNMQPPTGGGTWSRLVAPVEIESGIPVSVAMWWRVGGDSEPSDYAINTGASVGQRGTVVAVAGPYLAGGPAPVAVTVVVDGASTSIATPAAGPEHGHLDLRFAAATHTFTQTYTPPAGWALPSGLSGSQGNSLAAVVAGQEFAAGGDTGVQDWSVSGTTDGQFGATVSVLPGAQLMTVDQAPVNGVIPFGGTIAAGSPVSLWQPAPRGL